MLCFADASDFISILQIGNEGGQPVLRFLPLSVKLIDADTQFISLFRKLLSLFIVGGDMRKVHLLFKLGKLLFRRRSRRLAACRLAPCVVYRALLRLLLTVFRRTA